jgi:hypothetical protein
MAMYTVKFNDPNPVGDVDAYWINLYGADDSLVKTNTFTAPATPSTPARSFSFIAAIPTELPLKITIEPVKNGAPGPMTTYIAPTAPGLPVSEVTVTVS